MERIRVQLDESSWYYSWVLRKSRARDDIKDYMVKAHDSFNIMNLSVKVDNLFKSVASLTWRKKYDR